MEGSDMQAELKKALKTAEDFLPLCTACFTHSSASENWECANEPTQALKATVSSNCAWSARGGIPAWWEEISKKTQRSQHTLTRGWLSRQITPMKTTWGSKAPWIVFKSLLNSWSWLATTPLSCRWNHNKSIDKWSIIDWHWQVKSLQFTLDWVNYTVFSYAWQLYRLQE